MLQRARPEDADELAALFLASRRDALPFLPEIHSDEETHTWMREVGVGHLSSLGGRTRGAPGRLPGAQT